jgi:hypothetical protein
MAALCHANGWVTEGMATAAQMTEWQKTVQFSAALLEQWEKILQPSAALMEEWQKTLRSSAALVERWQKSAAVQMNELQKPPRGWCLLHGRLHSLMQLWSTSLMPFSGVKVR